MIVYILLLLLYIARGPTLPSEELSWKLLWENLNWSYLDRNYFFPFLVNNAETSASIYYYLLLYLFNSERESNECNV